jgi:PiT family inorganic phosphate transporter
MEVTVLLFLTSGLFLGWALGANDAANVFGTAVGTRMINFTTAAIICSVFLALGAVVSGAGAAHTLGKLGAVNALPGSFMAALSAALAVYMMTKAGLPVSTTQAIVGAIIGWNLFSNTVTDQASLVKILSTWVICPVLAAVIAMGLYKFVAWFLYRAKWHLLRTDAYTRVGLILAGAFGSYSLGANNIGNVMGVFISSSPFTDFSVAGLFTVSSTQQLFLVGAVAIGVGVMTYSKRVMMTVGSGLVPLSPVAAWVVVVSHSIVLFLFASQGLEAFLASHGLPTIPLVPVSSSQAVVGAVLGIAIIKGGSGIRWRVLGGISFGWMVTPLMAAAVCFVGLFFLQNVFDQKVYHPISYTLSAPVIEKLESDGVATEPLGELRGEIYGSAVALKDALGGISRLSSDHLGRILNTARIEPISIDDISIDEIVATGALPTARSVAIVSLARQIFQHRWALARELADASEAWHRRPEDKENKAYNKALDADLDYVVRLFATGR